MITKKQPIIPIKPIISPTSSNLTFHSRCPPRLSTPQKIQAPRQSRAKKDRASAPGDKADEAYLISLYKTHRASNSIGSSEVGSRRKKKRRPKTGG